MIGRRRPASRDGDAARVLGHAAAVLRSCKRNGMTTVAIDDVLALLGAGQAAASAAEPVLRDPRADPLTGCLPATPPGHLGRALGSYLPLITGGGGAIVVLCLWVYAFYSGKIHSDAEFTRIEAEITQLREENGQYRVALDTERRAVNETAQAGQVTNQLITALITTAGGRRQSRAVRSGKQDPDLTAEELAP